MIERIDTTEEYWKGQRENLRTARIEIWTDDPQQHFALDVGWIIADRELFEELRDLIEAASPDRLEQARAEVSGRWDTKLEDEMIARAGGYDLRDEAVTQVLHEIRMEMAEADDV